MSIYDKASLIQIPSGYRAGELYSVIPNSGAGDFTVTGDPEGEATRVNSQGLIENVSANVPRLDYPFIDGQVQDCPHLLLEPQRTNYAPYSEDFSSWGDVGATITPNAIISPNGTLNASKLVSTANNWRKSSSFTASSGVTYTVSIYAKLDTSTSTTTTRLEVYNGAGSLAANYNLLNETISNSGFTSVFIEPVEDDWYRIGGTYTAGGTNNILYIYPSAGYGTAGTMYFWGAQQEAGTYASSYIATNGSSVTRTQDKCLNAGSSSLFNDSEGTLFVDWKGFQAGVIDRRISLSDTSNNVVSLDLSSVSDRIKGSIYDGTNLRNFLSYGHTHTDRNKIAIRYKSGDSKMFVNGTEVASTTGTFSLSGLSTLSFSSRNQVAQFFEGEVYQTMVFNEALSDSELETLTTL